MLLSVSEFQSCVYIALTVHMNVDCVSVDIWLKHMYNIYMYMIILIPGYIHKEFLVCDDL